MLDLGWSELLVIGVVALIVIGPKDLPMVFRKAGQFMGRMRAMAREFTRAMEDAAEESGMKEASRTMRNAASGLNDIRNPGRAAAKAWTKATGDLDAELQAEPDEPQTETERLRAARERATAQLQAGRERKLAGEASAEDAPAAVVPDRSDAGADTPPERGPDNT